MILHHPPQALKKILQLPLFFALRALITLHNACGMCNLLPPKEVRMYTFDLAAVWAKLGGQQKKRSLGNQGQAARIPSFSLWIIIESRIT